MNKRHALCTDDRDGPILEVRLNVPLFLSDHPFLDLQRRTFLPQRKGYEVFCRLLKP